MGSDDSGNMKKLPLLLLTAPLLAISLTGCSMISGMLSNEQSSDFADVAAYTEFTLDTDAAAPWLPADATALKLVESTDGTTASLLLTSASTPDCPSVERLSGPSFVVPGSPDPYAAATVLSCGAWSVIPAKGGWYGWTPNHPEERVH